MDSSTPTPKVAAAGIAGAVTVLLIYVAGLVGLDDIPAEVSSAITALIAFAAGYLKS